MSSPMSGISSGSSSVQISGEGGDLQTTTDQMRKRKRMLSNRESARRSRMRKQKLMDDLTAQMNNLRAENNHILTNINLVTHLYLNVESENSVLRAQMSELNHRLHALNGIMISCVRAQGDSAAAAIGFEDHRDYDDHHHDLMINGGSDDFLNPWSLIHVNHPIMASPDVFMY